MHQQSSWSEDVGDRASDPTKSTRTSSQQQQPPTTMASRSRFNLSRRDLLMVAVLVFGAAIGIVTAALAFQKRHRREPMAPLLDLRPPRENRWQTRHLPLYFECESAACRATGEDLRKNVAWTLDPCADFYEYVCSSDRLQTNVYKHAVSHYLREVRHVIDKYANLGWFSRTALTKKITRFFSTCTSGHHDLAAWKEQLGTVWKQLGLDAGETKTEKILAQFSRTFQSFPIVEVSLANSSHKSCIVLTRPCQSGFDRNFEVPNVFSKLFPKLVQHLVGSGESHTEDLLNNVVHVERLIQGYSGPRGERYEPLENYGNLPVSDVSNGSKAFSWYSYLQSFLSGVVNVKKDSCVVLRSPAYLRHVIRVLPSISREQMNSFLKFRTALALMAFRRLVTAKSKKEKESLCTLATYKLYRFAFLNEFNASSILQVYVHAGEKEVILRMSYRNVLTDTEPVVQAHKDVDEALKKAKTEYFQLLEDVDHFYTNDVITPRPKELVLSFVHSQRAMTHAWIRSVVASGGKVQDTQLDVRWDFDPDTNILAVPVSIAPMNMVKGEKEFFLESTTLGAAMVRFLYEAFHEGPLFKNSLTKHGHKKNGTPATCFEKQYGLLSVNGTKIKGAKVLRTVSADNAMVPVLHKAFKTSLYIHKIEVINYKSLEMYLANLPDVDADQLFFLMFAQNFCEPHEDTEAVLAHAPWPPARIRLNVPLANYPEFAKAFKCNNGTAMNPKKRCSAFRLK